jgi:light-regulated signal transduction histidine kinase (bacteriophytochrome)
MNSGVQGGQDMDFMSICASEDLARLGTIQPHGCLLGVADDGRVLGASTNVRMHLDIDIDDILGADAASVTLPDGRSLADWIDSLEPEAHVKETRCPGKNGGWYDLYAHRTDELVIIELAVQGGTGKDLPPGCFEDLSASQNTFMAAAVAVQAVQECTQFDRVMIYRFLPDDTGDVIAESRGEDMMPFIGLRYPASDIPKNARELYLKTPIRIVADVHSKPYPVRSLGDRPVDLGMARLRAVSPYHIEYLKNMKVAATLVTSIIVNGRLWGLVSAHNNHPYRLTADVQKACLELTDALAGRIEELENREAARISSSVDDLVNDFMGDLSMEESFWFAGLFGNNRFIQTLDIHGCLVRIGDDSFSVGYTPPGQEIWKLVDHADEQLRLAPADETGTVWTTTRLKSVVGDYAGATCGAAYLSVSKDPAVSVIFFRNEMAREVYWGGNPDKAVAIDHGSVRISPRQSFEMWTQHVTDTSREWTELETEFLRKLGVAIRNLPDEEFKSLTTTQMEDRSRFTDLILDKRVSEVRSIVDDFVPEGIAAIAFSTAPQPVFLAEYANATFYNLLGINRTTSNVSNIESILTMTGLEKAVTDLASNSERNLDFVSPKTGQRLMKVRRLDLICRHSRDEVTEGLSVLYLHDDTERRRIVDALTVSKRQADMTSRFKSEILGGMSHELRTPLNAIIGYTELLMMGVVDDPEKSREYAATVNMAGKQMLELIEGLLDIAKIERGVLQIEETRIDPQIEVRNAVRMLTEHANEVGVSIETRFPPEPLRILGDRTAFRQVLVNLIGNAIKFSPPGGKVRIDVERTRMSSLNISVEDSGPGIAPEDRARVFEPFSQVEDVQARSRPGAGIGLSLVKSYIELHGGSVSIDDSPRTGGAVLRVKIPSWRVFAGEEAATSD